MSGSGLALKVPMNRDSEAWATFSCGSSESVFSTSEAMGRLTTKMELRPRVDKALSTSPTGASEPSGGSALGKPAVILGIGLPRSLSLPGMEIRRPPTERAVIELLRQTQFDLMLVSAKPEEEKVWNLIRLIRRHWPGLRWVLFSEDCTDALEIQARSMGAVCVSADQRTIEELAFG